MMKSVTAALTSIVSMFDFVCLFGLFVVVSLLLSILIQS